MLKIFKSIVIGENKKCVFYFTEKNATDFLASPILITGGSNEHYTHGHAICNNQGKLRMICTIYTLTRKEVLAGEERNLLKAMHKRKMFKSL